MLLLTNPPSSGAEVANREGTASFGALSPRFVYPPHTLATLVAVCREAGIEAALLDAVGEKLDRDAWIQRVAAAQRRLKDILVTLKPVMSVVVRELSAELPPYA